MNVCVLCGRRGTRGFVILRGKGLRYGSDEQLMCANTKACDRRRAIADQSWADAPERRQR